MSEGNGLQAQGSWGRGRGPCAWNQVSEGGVRRGQRAAGRSRACRVTLRPPPGRGVGTVGGQVVFFLSVWDCFFKPKLSHGGHRHPSWLGTNVAVVQVWICLSQPPAGKGPWSRHASDALCVPGPLSPRLRCRPDPSSWRRGSRRQTGLQVWRGTSAGWGLGGCAQLCGPALEEGREEPCGPPSSLPCQTAALGTLGIPCGLVP